MHARDIVLCDLQRVAYNTYSTGKVFFWGEGGEVGKRERERQRDGERERERGKIKKEGWLQLFTFSVSCSS